LTKYLTKEFNSEETLYLAYGFHPIV